MTTRENATQQMQDSSTGAANARASGIIIAAATGLSVLFLAHHPTSFAEARAIAGVHGALIATSVLLVIGYVGLADWLGWHRLTVRAGFVVYVLGMLAMMTAALINGFVLNDLVAASGGRDADLGAIKPLLKFGYHANKACDQLGIMATSAAMLFWSAALLAVRGAAKPIAVAGILIGFASAGLLLVGRLPMTIHGFGAFLLAQMLWNLAIAALLLFSRR